MDFSNLLNQFTAEDSLFILIVMIIAFLLGLLLGYVLRSRRVIQLKRELKDKKKELAEAQAKIENLQEQLGLKEADLKKLGFSVQEAEAKAERLEQEKEELHKRIFMLNQQLEEGEMSAAQQEQLAALEQEVAQLRERNEVLENQSSAAVAAGTAAAGSADLSEMKRRMDTLEQRLDQLSSDQPQQDKVSMENVTGPGVVAAGLATQNIAGESESVHPMPDLPDAELVNEEPNADFTADKTILQGKVSDQPEEAKDDLTKIEGIGPFLQQQLYNIGVHTYEEISSWDTERIREVTREIGYFEGRIEKDRWVEQAAQLAAQQPVQDAPAAPLSTDTSDLTVMEGLNEHAAQALVSAGIESWEALSECSAEQLQDILEASDLSELMPIAGSWPTQARLAKSGDWAVLKEYQEELRNA